MNTITIYQLLLISCLFTTSTEVEINKIESSSKGFQDVGLVEFENGVLFASDRVGADERKTNLLRLYYAEVLDDYTWDEPQLLSANSRYHLVPNDYCSSSEEIYFTGNSKDKDRNKVHKLAILKGNLEDGAVANLDYLTINNSKHNYAYPTLSENGRTLILAADIDGNFDLLEYQRESIDAAWTFHRKLEELESPFDEIHPNLLNDSTLVFSSNHDMGLGQFDLYSSKKVDGKWTTPINLIELNSAFDESNYLAFDDLNGYFTSSRDGAKSNIYRFEKKED